MDKCACTHIYSNVAISTDRLGLARLGLLKRKQNHLAICTRGEENKEKKYTLKHFDSDLDSELELK